MRIINILGSPRTSGNGATIAQLLIDIIKDRHDQIQTHALNQLTYRGCQACMACKKTADRCAVKDELTPVLEDIKNADLVILSSPVYFGEITAQAKGLVDRMFSFFGPDYRTNPHASRLAAGKSLVLILPQGNPDEAAFAEVVPRYTRIFTRLGFDQMYPIRALGAGIDSNIHADESIVQAIKATASKLLAAMTVKSYAQGQAG